MKSETENVLESRRNIDSEINTNISDYSIDDLLSLLDIKLSDGDNYENIADDINNKTDQYIEVFKNIKNQKIVDFFEQVRQSLIGKKVGSDYNITEAERLLEVYSAKDSNKEFKSIHGGKVSITKHNNVTKLLTIDSRFRRNYNESLSTNFSCFLPYSINNVTEIRLSDLEFPATFYPFQDEYENNYFWMKVEYFSTDSIDEVVQYKYIYFYVKPGNYYQQSLIEGWNNSLEGMQPPLPIRITHNMSFDNGGGVGEGDGKTSIVYTGATQYTIKNIEINFRGLKIPSIEEEYNITRIFDVENTDDADIINKYYGAVIGKKFKYKTSSIDSRSRIGWMLGYRKDLYDGLTEYKSEGQLEIIGPRYLYIILDDHNTSANSNFFTNNEQTILRGDIIARISIKAYAFSVQSQNDFSVYSEPRYYFGQVNIDKIDLKVVDEYNRIVNLNGMDFSLTLQMKVNRDN